jgi:flavin reductase (DIM6/NTAB) family NADH-FMN oxidoreductase RutF
MQKVHYLSIAEEALTHIMNGAFLTVKAEDKLNVMTIGWAGIGYVWQRPVLMVAVRKTRHTFKLIEQAPDFAVSVPLTDDKQKELDYCGTKSGRNVNKFKECGLEVIASKQIASPIVRMPGLHFECRIVCKTPMDPARIGKDLEKLYPQKDYHTLYFGEIKECYQLD